MRTNCLLLATLIALSLGACQGNAPEIHAPAAEAGRGGFLPAEFAEALAQVEAYPAPGEVDQARFEQLRQELRRVLLEMAAGGPAAELAKGASCLPAYTAQVVTEDDGKEYLEWDYTLLGDYDLNGEVSVADLKPLALNLMATSPGGPGGSFPPGDRAGWCDGDRNGQVNIADLTVIARYYAENIGGEYVIYRKDKATQSSPWSEMGSVPADQIADDMDPAVAPSGFGFRYLIEADHAGFDYRAIPRTVKVLNPRNETGSLDFNAPTLASVSGRVVGAVSGEAVAGAKVQLSQSGTDQWVDGTTDADGLYQFDAVETSGSSGIYVVRCDKPGYARATERVEVATGRNAICDMQLLTRVPLSGASAMRGTSVDVGSGVALTLPPGGLVKADGSPLASPREVDLTYLSPNDKTALASAPGDMTALQANYTQTRLATYGMVEVFIDDGTGQPGNLAEGQTATINFPIAEEDRAAAPATIGLYSFDESYGLWREEGTASKNGSGTAYVAQVTHFSYWNCDRPVNPTYITVRVEDVTGDPVVDAWVESAGVSYSGVTDQTTNSEGLVSFLVEQSAQEQLRAEYFGLPLGPPVIVNTPDTEFDHYLGPLVATFTVPEDILRLTVTVLSQQGLPVPFAMLQLRDHDGLWQRAIWTDANGAARSYFGESDVVDVWAEYAGFSCPPQTVNINADQDVALTLQGAQPPPVARFKVNTTSVPDCIAPMSLSLDASVSTSGAAVQFFRWQIFEGNWSLGDPIFEVSENDPLLDLVIADPGPHFIKLTVTDGNGQSDTEWARVCSY